MALTDWQGPIDRGSRLHSVQLNNQGDYARRLVAFSRVGWHSFTRVGAPSPAWAHVTRIIDRPQYVDIPLIMAIGQQQNTIVLSRQQFRKGNSAKKTYALAVSLRQSAMAIAAKRGG